MSTTKKTVKQNRQDIRQESIQEAICEESSSLEDTEEEQVTPTVCQGGVQPLQI